MDVNVDRLKLVANTLRILSAEGVQAANSGHPGLPMGAADMTAVLWAHFLRYQPNDPTWLNRDRFVLSAGHGSMLLYALLHLFGYDLSIEEIKHFRQWGSKTPGHPEFGWTPGVDATTGPLGQGFANGVGMALSSKMLAARYGSDRFNYRVFGLVSDGDLMEGVSAEAASLAGHLQLGNLVYLYDDNKISLADPTEVTFTEDTAARFRSYGWDVQAIDGHDVEEVVVALERAVAEEGRPSLICARTTIGFGSPNKSGTPGAHGAPLGPEELRLTKEALDWPQDLPFHVPQEVSDFCGSCLDLKQQAYVEWQETYAKWVVEQPEQAAQLNQQLSGKLPLELRVELNQAFRGVGEAATRSLSGQAIQIIARHLPGFIGGSADLEPSNNTLIKDFTDIQADSFDGRNIRFGVREHAMGAIINGLTYSGTWQPYGATFLVFSDYLRPAIRIAALSHLPSLFIFTHDSFFVGEDGPTHQPVEHAAALRAIPNLYVFRPADGLEVAFAYWAALERRDGPSALLLSRQNLPELERPADFSDELLLRGGYVIHEMRNAVATLIATGSEVSSALQVAERLASVGKPVRVVSMLCQELFMDQDQNYRDQVLPPDGRRVTIEAGITMGWDRFVGARGLCLGHDSFGASAPASVLAKQFHFTSDQLADRIASWLAQEA